MVKISKYYKTQKEVYKYLDNLLVSAKKKKTPIEIDNLIYDLTLNYEISEKAIIKRLEMATKFFDFEIKDREVVFK